MSMVIFHSFFLVYLLFNGDVPFLMVDLPIIFHRMKVRWFTRGSGRTDDDPLPDASGCFRAPVPQCEQMPGSASDVTGPDPTAATVW